MDLLLLALASLIAIVPAALAIAAGIGVPPQQGLLFGATELTLSAIAAGLAYQNRQRIWLQAAGKTTRLLMIAGTLAGLSLIGYLFVYNFCVVEHAVYEGKVLFPLWTSGRLAEMIQKAGSRYGAVDKYGLAAVFDAISEMPGTAYAVALGTLLLLYAPPLAVTFTIGFILALRYPSRVFQSSVAPGEPFDVFLCYNRADKLAVRAIAKELTSNHVRYFLDENENPPGQVWTEHVERALRASQAFAVFLGAAGVGRWQATEIQNISEARMERGCVVIPVLLPDAQDSARLPMQLAGLTWVDFRRSDPDPIAELIRGIRTRPSYREDAGSRSAAP
jgi:hypothetical protein